MLALRPVLEMFSLSPGMMEMTDENESPQLFPFVERQHPISLLDGMRYRLAVLISTSTLSLGSDNSLR